MWGRQRAVLETTGTPDGLAGWVALGRSRASDFMAPSVLSKLSMFSRYKPAALRRRHLIQALTSTGCPASCGHQATSLVMMLRSEGCWESEPSRIQAA